MIAYYKSIPAALMDLFPFVGLEVNKFSLATSTSEHTRITFYIDFHVYLYYCSFPELIEICRGYMVRAREQAKVL